MGQATERMPKTGGKTVAGAPAPVDEPEESLPATPQAPIEPKITKVTEELPVELNDVEWQNRAREMAQASKSVDEAVARKKSITSQATADVKVAEAKRDKLVDIVSTRTEMREVTVEVKYDYEAGTVTRTRTDNKEIISVRDMIDAERQAKLIDADDFIADGRAEERAADDAELADDTAAEAEMDADDIDDELLDDDEDDGPLDEDPLGDNKPRRDED